MKLNTFIAVWVVFFSLSFCASFVWSDPDNSDGPDIVTATDVSLPETSSAYTIAEFDQLTDEEKRQVYFTEPQRLPDNFQADHYHHIMYPQIPE